MKHDQFGAKALADDSDIGDGQLLITTSPKASLAKQTTARYVLAVNGRFVKDVGVLQNKSTRRSSKGFPWKYV